jgi:hypothetical protein
MFLYVLTAALFTSAAFSAAPAEEQKIMMLISYVREMKGAVFIRNGTEYSPVEAADHMLMKYNKVKERITTAQLFIDRIAAKSYLSGKDYMIRMPDGKTLRSADILNRRLKEIESGK